METPFRVHVEYLEPPREDHAEETRIEHDFITAGPTREAVEAAVRARGDQAGLVIEVLRVDDLEIPRTPAREPGRQA